MKQMLVAEKEKLEKELLSFAKKSTHVANEYDTQYSEYGDKSDENALEISEYLANKPLEMQFEKLLRDINKALERMDKGTYGICKYCDDPIEEKRLEARPTSSACVSCKKTLTQEV